MTNLCRRCGTLNSHDEPFCAECKLDFALGDDPPITTCWFCESEGKMTKEHVIPRWVIKEAGLTGRTYVHEIGRARNPTDPKSEMIYEPGRLAKRPTIEGHWAPVVCRDCNSGWMSKLQSDVRPTVTEFIRGNVPTMSSSEREHLLRWLGVITSCGEYYVGNPVITQFERSTLMRGSVYPQWLFSYACCGDDVGLNGTVQVQSFIGDLSTFPPSHLASAWITVGKTTFHGFAAGTFYDVWNCVGRYPDFQARYGLRNLTPYLKSQPAGEPGTLMLADVRRAQEEIRLRTYHPGRAMQPEDMEFMF